VAVEVIGGVEREKARHANDDRPEGLIATLKRFRALFIRLLDLSLATEAPLALN
jgi:hypothetical protein